MLEKNTCDRRPSPAFSTPQKSVRVNQVNNHQGCQWWQAAHHLSRTSQRMANVLLVPTVQHRLAGPNRPVINAARAPPTPTTSSRGKVDSMRRIAGVSENARSRMISSAKERSAIGKCAPSAGDGLCGFCGGSTGYSQGQPGQLGSPTAPRAIGRQRKLGFASARQCRTNGDCPLMRWGGSDRWLESQAPYADQLDQRGADDGVSPSAPPAWIDLA